MTEQLQSKIDSAKAIIASGLKSFKAPCTLWSGGKDSMVLLHLIMQLSREPLPVVCWREPWFPWKQAFVNRIIEEWSLTVYDYAPSRVELCDGNGRMDVINYYQTGRLANPTHLALARGTEPPFDGKPWLCGLDTFLTRPVGTFDFPWDLMFHGHKSTDDDPTSGGVPLKTDLFYRHNSSSSIFPLRNWTDDDVFAYIEDFGVPYDTSRYEKAALGWKILKDKTNNPDYYHTCFACCDRSKPEFVYCPKLDMDINNISAMVAYGQPSLSYCTLRTDGK